MLPQFSTPAPIEPVCGRLFKIFIHSKEKLEDIISNETTKFNIVNDKLYLTVQLNQHSINEVFEQSKNAKYVNIKLEDKTGKEFHTLEMTLNYVGCNFSMDLNGFTNEDDIKSIVFEYTWKPFTEIEDWLSANSAELSDDKPMD